MTDDRIESSPRNLKPKSRNHSCVNIKLTVEYDGTNYCGWQVQPNGESIQAVLERAIATFLGKHTRITGSGRTDAGVHALSQVANFHSEKEFDPHRIRRALNAH
jgi:tRNA pseudouridine38-40 synthase